MFSEDKNCIEKHNQDINENKIMNRAVLVDQITF